MLHIHYSENVLTGISPVFPFFLLFFSHGWINVMGVAERFCYPALVDTLPQPCAESLFFIHESSLTHSPSSVKLYPKLSVMATPINLSRLSGSAIHLASSISEVPVIVSCAFVFSNYVARTATAEEVVVFISIGAKGCHDSWIDIS